MDAFPDLVLRLPFLDASNTKVSSDSRTESTTTHVLLIAHSYCPENVADVSFSPQSAGSPLVDGADSSSTDGIGCLPLSATNVVQAPSTNIVSDVSLAPLRPTRQHHPFGFLKGLSFEGVNI